MIITDIVNLQSAVKKSKKMVNFIRKQSVDSREVVQMKSKNLSKKLNRITRRKTNVSRLSKVNKMKTDSDIIYGQISLETPNRDTLDSNMEIHEPNFHMNKPFVSEGIKEVTKMTDHTSHYMRSLHNSVGHG
jgi:hypothetical protein